MGTTGQKILNAALKLPEAERATLAERLLETLSPDIEEAPEPAVEKELDRRLAEFGRSEAGAIGWIDLKRRR